jgi:hypothetical protein
MNEHPEAAAPETNPEQRPSEPFAGALPTILLAIAILSFINLVDYGSRVLVAPHPLAVLFTLTAGLCLFFSWKIWERKKFAAYGYAAVAVVSFALKIAFGEQIGFSLWEPLSLPALAIVLRRHWDEMG